MASTRGPPNHGPFPEPPRTPVPVTYGSLNLAEGEVVSVPPNPPGTVTFSDQRDFATRNWPSEGELAPDEEYYIEPIPEARGQRTVYRGSTLVFNVPVDDALTLHGVALVVEGNVVAISRHDSTWPDEVATNDI